MVLRKYASSLKTYANQSFDRIVPPPEEPPNKKSTKRSRFDILDDDGIASPGLPIAAGDVYINKQTPVNTQNPLPNLDNLPDSGTEL